MKQNVMLIILLVLCASWAMARGIAIEFTYDDQEGSFEAETFNVYTDGELLCNAEAVEPTGPGPRVHECSIDHVPPGIYDFTMAAVMADGSRSPFSLPYNFEIVPGPLAPQIIRITTEGETQ